MCLPLFVLPPSLGTKPSPPLSMWAGVGDPQAALHGWRGVPSALACVGQQRVVGQGMPGAGRLRLASHSLSQATRHSWPPACRLCDDVEPAPKRIMEHWPEEQQRYESEWAALSEKIREKRERVLSAMAPYEEEERRWKEARPERSKLATLWLLSRGIKEDEE